MSSEIAALDELKGRCTFLKVEYPDTTIRMDSALEVFVKMMGRAVKRGLTKEEIDELAEEMYSLRDYLRLVRNKYPEVRKDFDPTIKVCDWLLSTD